MADVTAAMVKDLRERTGAGMMECKKALVEANGDMSVAEDIIAKSGHKKAAKNSSRTAAEGRIAIAGNAQSAIVLEVNCETDFVGKDESFVKFGQQVADKALSEKCNDVEKLNATILDANQTVDDVRKGLIIRLGENIQVRRIAMMNAGANEKIGSYLHNGRIGTLVLISGGNDALAKDIAMHVAAMRPQFMKLEDVPQEIVAKEKEIMMERAKQSGKPENILEKIVQGMLQKHFAEVCLSGQPFFKDPDQTVGALLKSNNANLLQMIRFEVGEGIEVTKKSFEEEVAQARGSN